jgi:hypothetical protein
MESLDPMDAKQTAKKSENRDSSKHKKSLKKHKVFHGKCTGDCVIHWHGKGYRHSSEECKVILGMVDPKKKFDKNVSFKKDYKKNEKKTNGKSKMRSLKSEDAKDKTKKNLTAFIGN